MKDQKPNINDSLSKVLKEWKTDASLPPRFQETVWQRIDQTRADEATESFFQCLRSWATGFVTRPATAVAYLAVLLSIGMTVGWTQGNRETSRVKNQLGSQYVRLVDPYLTPRR